MNNDLLTSKEVAAMLKCTPATVATLVKQGAFPGATKVSPYLLKSHLRIPREAVEKFMQSKLITPEPQPDQP
jgi:excisionase family DNA binding protein